MNVPDDRPPWWLWPNLLALDAPAVAVVWQRFLAAVYGLTLPAAASVSLGLAVWGVYLLDRGLDARPHRPADPADRHRFARRHRHKLTTAGVLALLGAVVAAIGWLPSATLIDGTLVGVVLAGYLLAVHFVPVAWGGKELVVGLVFAAGVGVPLAARLPDQAADWGPAVLAFASVCWLNCLLIDRWEKGRPTGGRPVVAGIIAIVSCVSVETPRAVVWAVVWAVILLVGLHVFRHRLGVRLLRVWADAALLGPLAFGWTL